MRFRGQLDDDDFQYLFKLHRRPDPRGYLLLLSTARQHVSPQQTAWEVEIRGVPALLWVETMDHRMRRPERHPIYPQSSFILIDAVAEAFGLRRFCDRCRGEQLHREVRPDGTEHFACPYCGAVAIVPPADGYDIRPMRGVSRIDFEEAYRTMAPRPDPRDVAAMQVLEGRPDVDEDAETWRDRPPLL